MKKRLTSFLLVICMVFSLVPATAFAAVDRTGTSVELTNPFKDVKETDWFHTAVQYARINGFFSGTSKTTFDPNGTMTRGMFVTVLGRMAGVDIEQYKGSTGFSDVPERAYYAPYVSWAARHGITAGTGDGKFSPDALINREQMATFFVGYFEKFGVKYDTGVSLSTLPDDLAQVSFWAKSAVTTLWTQGLMVGDGKSFDPSGSASRAQAAALCMSTDSVVETWYKEPGIPSDRVKLDPTTGLPYETVIEEETPVETVRPTFTRYDVVYTDGVAGEEIFEDQCYRKRKGASTPAFEGTPTREGYVFVGWSPEISETVKRNVTYTAQWEEEASAPTTCAVSFYDSGRLIDTLYTERNEPLGALPSVEKTSKADGILEGYFTDPGFTRPFYADEPVVSDMKVYAKYTELSGSELTLTSFAQMDLDESASFTVMGSGSLSAITLIPKDGSDPVSLTITPISGGYTITAADGFLPGASYELTIPEGLNFVGSNGETLPDSIRTASFSIEKEEVQNIRMSEFTRFVQHPTPSLLRAGSLVTVAGAAVGDLICFYHTTNPENRDYTTSVYADDPETWFKVASVNGSMVTLAELEDEDTEKMYDVPDNFPVIGDPAAADGTLTLADDGDGYTLDTKTYALMLLGDDSITADLAYAQSKLTVGDFLSIYPSAAEISSTEDVYFGKITGYDPVTGVITYILSSAEEIETAVDLYVKPVLEGDDLISEEAREEIQQTVLAQVQESGFAEDAAFLLAELAAQTDGFRNMDSIQVLLTDENGEPLSDEEIALLNLGATFELSDDIELTVEVITSGDQLHFEDEGSVQLAIGIDAQFEVEVEDDGKICIDLSAVFAQEMAIGLSANGGLVMKEVLGFIPVPIGVKVGAAFDLYSYTGVRVDVHAYTVAPEDESLFDQFKDVLSNPEKLVDVLPDEFDELKKGLETVGDVYDKIEELEGMMEQAREDTETYLGYAEDLANLWDAVDAMDTDGKYTREDWQELGQTFGKTNVSGDLMDMLNLSTQTELDADRYAESLQDLLTKYSEMLENETDWVTLVEEEIGKFEYNFYGLVLFMKADFLVHTDINIAMGANLQYEVGKRYNFWLKIGLFRPEAGSSTMDLVDEQFAFQFYVMGKLGLKMGIKGAAGFAIGTADVASVALALEIGPYVKLYGFFIYEYERLREANASVWISDERMAGALYLDFGLYMVISLEAEALGLFEVSHDFFDEEFPLLEAGKKKYPYQFHYEPEEDELVLVLDEDGNSTNGITMELPEEYRALSYCNLVTGYMGATAFDWDCYNVYLSNPAFSIDENGVISVEVPEDTRYMECDMVLTYKFGKLAFSTYDMQVTIPLVWTNLSLDEVSQYYTACVRVGNDTDGYDIVWSQKVRKNEEFTLPTEEELTELIGYNEAIYSSISYPDAGKTTSIIANTSYDCTVSYTQYSIRVSGIQKDNGSTTSRTFYTTYGGTFDFSSLADTGTDIENDTYTRFAGVTTDAAVTANKQTRTIDLTQPITGAVAEAVMEGITAEAVYVDDSVLLTYVFSGIETDPVTERIRKGSQPSYDINAVAAQQGMAVKSVTPALGAVSSTTTYYVECSAIEGKSHTIFFEENGGSEIADITRVSGSLIGTLPVPTRSNHSFVGWYEDAALTDKFTATLMPDADTTLYAKWKANSYTVTFNVNGGDSWSEGEGSKTVVYGSTYGTLPVPTRDGHSFVGWYTDTEYTTQVTKKTVVSFSGSQTLYAKWHELVEIEKSFAYETPETNPIYTKGVAVEITPSAWAAAPEGAPALDESDFTIKFMRQGNAYYEEGYPVDAGTYDVTITRPADDYYAPFSQTIIGVLTIDKAVRTLDAPQVEITDQGFTYLDVKLGADAVYDLSADAQIIYTIDQQSGDLILPGKGGTGTSSCVDEAVRVAGLMPDTTYAVKVGITGDSNYHDVEASGYSDGGVTLSAPTDSWLDYMEPVAIEEGVTEYTITTAGQLAWLADQVKAGNDFVGYVFKLGCDIDLRAHMWFPIGVREYCNLLIGSNKYRWFKGSFDGSGYTVSGLYTDMSAFTVQHEYGYTKYSYYAGLFGLVGGGSAAICNVTLQDSYICGASYSVGGIIGDAQGGDGTPVTVENCVSYAVVDCRSANSVGGIVGEGVWTNISSCVNYGTVNGYGGDNAGVGGIVGFVNDSSHLEYANVVDCVNYGTVSGGSGNHVGGIAGYVVVGRIVNSANFGTVSGKQHCVGGITGEHSKNENAKTMNCVNYGAVSGSGNYIGSVIGRNYKNKGTVKPVYYYRTANPGLKSAGTDDGSTDSVKNLSAIAFTSINSTLQDNLNSWSSMDAYEGSEWVKDSSGFGYIPESVYEMLNEDT